MRRTVAAPQPAELDPPGAQGAIAEALGVSGYARCSRCGEPIAPGDPFDAGHDDVHPHLYTGPEHPGCNRAAPHRNVTSREW